MRKANLCHACLHVGAACAFCPFLRVCVAAEFAGDLTAEQVEDVIIVTTAATYSEEVAAYLEGSENEEALSHLFRTCNNTKNALEPGCWYLVSKAENNTGESTGRAFCTKYLTHSSLCLAMKTVHDMPRLRTRHPGSGFGRWCYLMLKSSMMLCKAVQLQHKRNRVLPLLA